MVKRRSKKSVARKVKRRILGKKASPRKMERGYDIHPPASQRAAKCKRCTDYKTD
jgi:hypothetical protein